jgi:DNA invertase Pin-like site-specific DNA recombinase
LKGEQIDLVAEDLGQSGKFTENQDGFQRLAAAVSLGRVGAVFMLEASRLARSSADWHRSLEIACLTRTLIIDESTVCDPRDPNDRPALGMKGTMADFELVWLRQRMDGGRWHLARKGELRVHTPLGYVYEGNRLVFDPDEEVRRAVALLFERFGRAASCQDLVCDFVANNLRFPSRQGKPASCAGPPGPPSGGGGGLVAPSGGLGLPGGPPSSGGLGLPGPPGPAASPGPPPGGVGFPMTAPSGGLGLPGAPASDARGHPDSVIE